MDLLREWRRRAVGGTAAALLVPVGIVAAAAGLGLTGGFGGLGSLGQAFSGPAAPALEPRRAAAASADGDDPGDLLADAAAAPGARVAAGRTAAAPRTSVRRPGTRRGDRRRPRRPSPGATRPRPTPPPQSQPTPAPAPAPTEPPSTIRQVGDQVKEVTSQVPVAGEPAGQVVDMIVDTAEQLPLPEIPGLVP